MTAITPLELVHKKGTFGDHHKKNEKDLVQISEVKDLMIAQVVQYKKSKVELEGIRVDKLKLPIENSRVESNSDTRILWNAPRTWLIISSKENILSNIKDEFDEQNFSVTDISHSRAIIKIKGSFAKEILKKGCPINFNDFKVNDTAGTIFSGISIVIDLIDQKPDTFHLLTLRSFGESFYHHITDAALEFGYVGL